jgi:hypothetical protein
MVSKKGNPSAHRGSPGLKGQNLAGSTRMAKRTMSKPGHGMGRGKRRMKRA